MPDKPKDQSQEPEIPDGIVEVPKVSLRESREAHGLSIEEVADRLHLDRDVVLALEAEDYESLGAPVFVRGYLRSYAKLLGLSEDEAAAAYATPEPEPEEFRTLSAPPVVKSGASLANFLLWVGVGLVVLAGAGYLLMGDPEPTPDTLDKGRFVEPAPVEAPPAERPADNVSDAEDMAAEVPQAEDPATEGMPSAPVEPPPAPEPEVMTVNLGLVFSDECWIEISDARTRLLYGLEKAGREVTLRGTPPFRLFVGNVAAVDITLDGVPFTVPGASRTGSNTARFTIDTDDLPEAGADE